MFRCVIVPLDGSSLAEQALDSAVAIAQQFRILLLLLLRAYEGPLRTAQALTSLPAGVLGRSDRRMTGALAEIATDEAVECSAYLAEQAERLGACGLDVETRLNQSPGEISMGGCPRTAGLTVALV